MGWLGIGVGILLAGGLLAWTVGRRPRLASAIGSATAVAGSLAATIDALRVLALGEPVRAAIPWPLPLGTVTLGLDALSAVFLALIAAVVALAAIYGAGYLDGSRRSLGNGALWFFFNLLAATMLLVVAARDGVFFLVCWEGMSLASFFLVLSEYDDASVRRAAWTYVVAMHLGTACLLAFFLLLGRGSGSLDFDRVSAEPGLAGAMFLLAVVGFGTKAGLIPLHVWLPDAHPAAPSHVSAVMSGVMIKTGIYGLLRSLQFLGEPPAWWGWTLIAVGALSGLLGVLFALAQTDLKRMLAYCSVENVGIITLGLGVGMLGVSHGIPAMAFLGFLGAILHVINHALFKSLLFLVAGAVQHSTGTRDMDRLGGLLKRMPVTGAAFLVGACAISGLPPLNGFVSEALLVLAVLAGVADPARMTGLGWPLLCVLCLGGLGLIGGLASACFTRAFGCVALGEPRTADAERAHEPGLAMRWPMVLLAAACFLVALTAPLWPRLLAPCVAGIAPALLEDGTQNLVPLAATPLAFMAGGSWLLLAVAIALAAARRRLLAGRVVAEGPTWDCGYASPLPRMQYTASSFAEPAIHFFRMFLRPRVALVVPRGPFPDEAQLACSVPDPFRERGYRPLFQGMAWLAARLRWLQQGRIQLYVLYIALTVLVLLVWKLG